MKRARRSLKERQRALRRKQRRRQVTCLCGRYDFPHRLGGGKCYGRDWAASYYETEGWCCARCNAKVDGACEVAAGQEEIRYCEGASDHLHTSTKRRHPYNVSDNEDDQSGESDLITIDCPF
jgi:hypothetical protein